LQQVLSSQGSIFPTFLASKRAAFAQKIFVQKLHQNRELGTKDVTKNFHANVGETELLFFSYFSTIGW